jgi:hypothetical protein
MDRINLQIIYYNCRANMIMRASRVIRVLPRSMHFLVEPPTYALFTRVHLFPYIYSATFLV